MIVRGMCMKQIYGLFLACRIEWHWRFMLRCKKRGNHLIKSGSALDSPEIIKLNRMVSNHGVRALNLQNEYEQKVLS